MSVVNLVMALVGLLLIAVVVLAMCKRFKVPFTVALVVVGIVIANLAKLGPEQLAFLANIHISPQFILFVCLPTLIFESAIKLDPRQLRQNLLPILTLAIPGLLLSTFIIGTIVTLLSPIPFTAALLLGAILSATDPVAVISLFNQLGAPKRLTVLVEGESLFNDATAIVTAKILLVIVLAGVFSGDHISHGFLHFIEEFFGGIIVGWLLAIIVGYILGFVERDPFIEISLITILAYASFLVADQLFHVSGVMATLTAGLVMGTWGRAKISASILDYLKHYWEFLAYIANVLIFLLVGLSVNLGELTASWSILLIVIVAMLLSRAVVVFGLVPLLDKFPNTDSISMAYKIIMFWGGLRGAIALAIVLSLGNFEYADLFIVLVTGAVLFTLLVKGLTIDKVVHYLKLDRPPLADRLSKSEGMLAATRQAMKRIPELQAGGLFSARIATRLEQRWRHQSDVINKKMELLRSRELNQDEEKKILFLQCLSAMKMLFFNMFCKGHLSERAYHHSNDYVERLLDKLRYFGMVSLEKSNIVDNKFTVLLSYFSRVPMVKKIPEWLQEKKLVNSYEELWSLHQGCVHVLKNLDSLAEAQSVHPEVDKKVRNYFQVWRDQLQQQLDAIAEQFPEFVNAMQERLAERLMLHAQLDAVESQAKSGAIPLGVAETMCDEILRNLRKFRQKVPAELAIDPLELLGKIPFFKDVPQEEFRKIQALLKPHLYTASDYVIREGETGKSLYLIMRGVVRVTKKMEGEEKDVATLIAGDFFGEMALLHDEHRSASCRAVTPCAIYELKRESFDKISQLCPAIISALRKADEERRRAL